MILTLHTHIEHTVRSSINKGKAIFGLVVSSFPLFKAFLFILGKKTTLKITFKSNYIQNKLFTYYSRNYVTIYLIKQI